MKHDNARIGRVITIIGAMSLYPLSYLALSLNGIYYPAAIGLTGVKWYNWAPMGFASRKEYRWNIPIALFYLPLWHLDKKYWHESELARTGEYPKFDLSMSVK